MTPLLRVLGIIGAFVVLMTLVEVAVMAVAFILQIAVPLLICWFVLAGLGHLSGRGK